MIKQIYSLADLQLASSLSHISSQHQPDSLVFIISTQNYFVYRNRFFRSLHAFLRKDITVLSFNLESDVCEIKKNIISKICRYDISLPCPEDITENMLKVYAANIRYLILYRLAQFFPSTKIFYFDVDSLPIMSSFADFKLDGILNVRFSPPSSFSQSTGYLPFKSGFLLLNNFRPDIRMLITSELHNFIQDRDPKWFSDQAALLYLFSNIDLWGYLSVDYGSCLSWNFNPLSLVWTAKGSHRRDLYVYSLYDFLLSLYVRFPLLNSILFKYLILVIISLAYNIEWRFVFVQNRLKKIALKALKFLK